MQLLTRIHAKNFCRSFSGAHNAVYYSTETLLNSRKSYIYDSLNPDYSELRDALLRDAEANALLGEANLARSLRGLHPHTSHWSIVTLYYCSFFFAHSLLNMHGGWFKKQASYISVEAQSRQKIKLRHYKAPHPAATRLGLNPKESHIAFWAVFYDASQQLRNYAPQQHQWALSPIGSEIGWLTARRNEYNYHIENAVSLNNTFSRTFTSQEAPDCFPSDLRMLFNIALALRNITHYFIEKNQLNADIISSTPIHGEDLKSLIWDREHQSIENLIDSI